MRLGYNLKRVEEVISALFLTRRLVAHDRWTSQELQAYQRQRLRSLIDHAMKHSPFYRDLYSHISPDERLNLQALPVLDKTTMMENFDRFVTDPRLKLEDLERHISHLSHDEYYLDEYRVLSTGGSSGVTGVFAFNRKEWTTVLATSQRMARYMGVSPRVRSRIRLTTIGAHHPRHGTTRVPESMNVPLVVLQQLDAADPIGKLVESLNTFQPEIMFTYPSVGALLAIEQIEGHLQIRPRVVWVSGEVCTEDMKQKMQMAWGERPFEVYALTEAMFLGTNCPHDRGIHAFEDIAILEVVDEENGPVPDGVQGHKVLITNLYYYTQPLIRYEASDLLRMAKAPCPCGRPFRLIDHIEGRSDDILELEGMGSKSVQVHPINFRSVLGALSELRQYQVVHEENGIHLNLVPRGSVDRESLSSTVESIVRERLKSLGAKCPPLYLHFVTQIEREQDQIGKLKLIKQLKRH